MSNNMSNKGNKVGSMLAYLDHAATSPMRPEAKEAMIRAVDEGIGNPSGLHSVARRAAVALDEAREGVAESLGGLPSEVVFTSGGTESDNLAILGAHSAHPGMVLCSSIEHHAVLASASSIGARVIPVGRDGIVDLFALERLIDPSVSIVSVMLVNNETGIIQPIDEIAEIVRKRAPEAVLHTDAVAAFPFLDVAKAARSADMVSISAHKFGGPQGVGALLVRQRVSLVPLLRGGGQERGLRSGTHNMAGILAMAAAASATVTQRESSRRTVERLRDRLADGLLSKVDGAMETGNRADKVVSNCHLCFPAAESEAILFLADQQGVCASAGSACSSGAMEMSHVLAAMGLEREVAKGAVRFTLGWNTSDEEIDLALAVIPEVVEQVRSRSVQKAG